MSDSKLYDYVDPADAECVRIEVSEVMQSFFPEFGVDIFRDAFDDVEQLFFGNYPGYKASNTKYHDFEHTCSVVLANLRLIYGAMVEGHSFTKLEVTKGLLAALFHDVGLIQTTDDATGTGAKYTVGHEERSIQFMRENLNGTLSAEDVEDIADCIRCTILAMSPKKVAFSTPNMKMMGNFLGTADLLAQIADRYYLEKLLLLFEEFQEAKLPGYATPLDLLFKTRNFYQDVARARIDNDLDQADKFMKPYFKHRWDVDQDLYLEAIERNLDYLDSILEGCKEDLDCFMQGLRRGGISVDIMK